MELITPANGFDCFFGEIIANMILFFFSPMERCLTAVVCSLSATCIIHVLGIEYILLTTHIC